MKKLKDKELVDIAAQVRHETQHALLLNDGAVEAWVPRSLIEDNGDNTFTMPTWLAKNKRFI